MKMFHEYEFNCENVLLYEIKHEIMEIIKVSFCINYNLFT